MEGFHRRNAICIIVVTLKGVNNVHTPSFLNLSTHAETLPHIMGEILIYQNYNLTFVVEIIIIIENILIIININPENL